MARGRPKTPLDVALAALFEAGGSSAVSYFSLPGGAPLFSTGEPADTLFLLRSGRLGVFKQEEGQDRHLIGVIKPGEPAGEMSLLAGTAHSATALALRDSEIAALPRDAFFEAARQSPGVMVELARLMIQRTRQSEHGFAAQPSVFGFVSVGRQPVRPLVEQLEAEIARQGFTVAVVDSTALRSAGEWFARVEESSEYVLYMAEAAETAWARLVARQADRLFVIAPAAVSPEATPWDEGLRLAPKQVDLILLHEDGPRAPAAAWLDHVKPTRWFHLRPDLPADVARLGRVLTGSSIGLVLSGGGARAYVHLGALRALRRAGVPIDFVCGSSMGAIIAAGVAMGWDAEEQEARTRKAFVESSPLDDVAVPILAMTHGRKVDARLVEHFADARIEDLPLPFFAVSSNITSGGYMVHKRGELWRALRASISLPGILPPVVMDGSVLVDGAVVRNYPAELMRGWHLGPVVGVDVTLAQGVEPAAVQNPKPWWRWLLSGEWRQGPPIVSILMRSGELSSRRDWRVDQEATDLLVAPDVTGIELRDWKAFDPAIAAGERAMDAALAQLDGPVETLRRRKLAAVEQAEAIGEPPGTAAETETASSRPRVAGKP